MPRRRSLRLLELLEELTKDWADPKRYRDYYVNELLSSLKDDPERESIEERLIMVQIREIASPDEWEHLGELVANLDRFKDQPEDIIKDLFSKKQYKEAKRLYENTLPDIFNCLRSQHIELFKRKFDRHLKKDYDYAIRHDLDRIADLMTEAEWNYLDKRYWDREIELSLPWLESCLFSGDYKGAEAWYGKIQKAFPREKFDEIVAEAKIRRIEQKRRDQLENVRCFIKYHLEKSNYDDAHRVYKSNPEAFSIEEYEELVREAKIKDGKVKE